MNSCQRAIVKTVTYFDLFEYPLTSFEVWKWLWVDEGQTFHLEEVAKELEALRATQQLNERYGYWFLPGRESLVATRQARHRLSIHKTRRAKRVARLFGYIPFVQGVAACNSLGYRNTHEKSDLDLLVICSPGTIWTTRLLTAGLMALRGERPTALHTADTVCLSFFVASDSLNLEPLKKIGGDAYLTYWVTQLTPLFGRGAVWKNFLQANAWVKAKLPHTLPYRNSSSWLYKGGAPHQARVPGFIEKAAARFQEKKFPVAFRETAAQNNNVVISGSMLKFHLNDRREEYQQRWQGKVSSL